MLFPKKKNAAKAAERQANSKRGTKLQSIPAKSEDNPKPCKRCEKETPIFETSAYRGMCRACWVKEVARLREKYGKFTLMLRRHLTEHGVVLKENYTDGLDETGRPLCPVRDAHNRAVCLRKDEYALWLLDVRDAVFAFPDNAIGLRYTVSSAVEAFMDRAYALFRVSSLLTAVSDGHDLYALDERGKILSTDPAWHGKILFDAAEYCLQLAETCFTKEEVQRAVDEFCTREYPCIKEESFGFCPVGGLFYDRDVKKFFEVSSVGNYYHGYELSYYAKTKEEVMNKLMKSIDIFTDDCLKKNIPMLVLVNALPYEAGPYDPPKIFGTDM